MSSKSITKENFDTYLKALAKAYRKSVGKPPQPAEILLVGGAAVLTRFGFRDMTTDVDAILRDAGALKEAANQVSDDFGLPNGWLNDDFRRTSSFSPRLQEHSIPYKSFYNVLEVRTVSDENLIAMKLRSGRKYKNDFSDVIGILSERKANGKPVTREAIDTAVNNLYGGWDGFPEESKPFIENMLERDDLESVYAEIRNDEIKSKDILLDFEKNYPHVTNTDNINDILKALKAKQDEPTQNTP